MASFGQMGNDDLVVRADLLHSSFGRASGGLRSLSQLLQLDEQQATFEPLLFQLARPLADHVSPRAPSACDNGMQHVTQRVRHRRNRTPALVARSLPCLPHAEDLPVGYVHGAHPHNLKRR